MDTPSQHSDPRLHEWQALLQSAPDIQLLELLIADMNGILRGKRVGRREIEHVVKRGFNMPGSSVMLDSKGQTIDGVPYGTRDGDPDVYCKVIPGSLASVPWAGRRSAQALVTMARSSRRLGAKMPGVSTKISCAAPSVTMPRTGMRVVCTL